MLSVVLQCTLLAVLLCCTENTVPSWTVPVYAIGAPLLAFSLARLVLSPRKVTTDVWYRTLYACLFAIFLTAAITNCLKIAIGRPRPNFVFRCWPDGAPV
ncbi:acidPPc domain-containing protein, partial [Haematococcus lacustris]